MGAEMSDLAEDVMKVCWTQEDGQEEAPGLYVYGYWRGEADPRAGIPAWAWSMFAQFDEYHLTGKEWHVVLWTIRLRKWPTPQEWEASLRNTFQSMLDSGAKAAWCATEGYFADPPSLFEDAMAEGVYAAQSPALGFKCATGPGRPFATLSTADIRILRGEL